MSEREEESDKGNNGSRTILKLGNLGRGLWSLSSSTSFTHFKIFIKQFIHREISGSHGGEYEDDSLLEYTAV
jgi:hypothetical protein